MILNTLTASIVIPSLNRPKELVRCQSWLAQQTCQPAQVIVLTERGPLAAIRNQGLAQVTTDLVVFIDDDVVCPPYWLEAITDTFQVHPEYAGVSGPAIIPEPYLNNRDLFRYRRLKRLYDWLFLLGRSDLPGHITSAGAFTTGACREDCTYEGPVHFLEACNMAFRTAAIQAVGGFDESYGGIGDWSEPDVCYRIRQRGGQLFFSPRHALYHLPSTTGAYLSRAHTGARLSNYALFARRWVTPSWRHCLYRCFLHTYYAYKESQTWRSSHR